MNRSFSCHQERLLLDSKPRTCGLKVQYFTTELQLFLQSTHDFLWLGACFICALAPAELVYWSTW